MGWWIDAHLIYQHMDNYPPEKYKTDSNICNSQANENKIRCCYCGKITSIIWVHGHGNVPIATPILMNAAGVNTDLDFWIQGLAGFVSIHYLGTSHTHLLNKFASVPQNKINNHNAITRRYPFWNPALRFVLKSIRGFYINSIRVSPGSIGWNHLIAEAPLKTPGL